MIDDLATTGGSKFEAIEKLTSEGLCVEDIVVLIDRQSGAGKALAEAGFRLHSVAQLTELLDYYEMSNKVKKIILMMQGNFYPKTCDTLSIISRFVIQS